jgi:ubiquinone/menaquinone biosynthesis C-methylase UbiE
MTSDLQGYDPAAFSQIAELEDRSWWFRSRNRLIEQTVRGLFPNAASVLEIGCGTGYTLRALRNALPQAELTGTELFEEGLRVARDRWDRVRLLQADARALPFGSEFELVGAFDVLEHIDDDVTALSELRRVVRPRGGLIITVPQHAWLWSAADDYAHHQRRYSRSQLLSRIQAAGFTVELVTSFVTVPLPAMAISRISARSRRDSQAEFDPWAEFRIPRFLNSALERLAAAERYAIARGASLPVGGSLLVAGTAA